MTSLVDLAGQRDEEEPERIRKLNHGSGYQTHRAARVGSRMAQDGPAIVQAPGLAAGLIELLDTTPSVV